MVRVAQSVRALVCGAGGRGFETHRAPIVWSPDKNCQDFFCNFNESINQFSIERRHSL